MGKFDLGDKVHCVVPGNYFFTGVGVECVVTCTDPFRVRLSGKPEGTAYHVWEKYFELIPPISLENI